MKRLVSILLFLLAFNYSCTTPFLIKVDEDLQEYVYEPIGKILDTCSHEKIHYPSLIRVKFVDQFEKLHKVGSCVRGSNFFQIEILKPAWAMYGHELKSVLMYHEIGHCVLKLNHSDDPNDFMYPIIGFLDKKTLDRQLEAYMEQCKK